VLTPTPQWQQEFRGEKHMAIMNEVKFKLVLRTFAVVNKGEIYVKNLKAAA
jgi:hypothetical protein